MTYLLKRHANPASTNKQGKTAMDLAKSEEVRAALGSAAEESAAAATGQKQQDQTASGEARLASAAEPPAADSPSIGPGLPPARQQGTAPEPTPALQDAPQHDQAARDEPASSRKRPAESQDNVVAVDPEPDRGFNPNKRVAQDLYQDDA